jgi:hypothetical protein
MGQQAHEMDEPEWTSVLGPDAHVEPLCSAFVSVMFFTCVMNVIEANPDGFSSSFIDQYTFSDMMLIVNLFGLFGAGVLVSYHAFQERRPRHGGRDIYWPVRETDLISLHQAHPEMIASLNGGKRLLEEGLNTPEEFYPRQNLLDAVNGMRTLLQEAKARREGKLRRSLLDDRKKRPSNRQLTRAEELDLLASLKLGEEKSRALEWTLQDMVEDLSLLYNTITARVKSASGTGGLDQELARFDRIQGSFEGFSSDLSIKSKERALMHPLKRDFLAKLLVLKGLVSTGNENFVYGERPPWSAPNYMPPLVTEEEEQAQYVRQFHQQQQQKEDELKINILAESPRSHRDDRDSDEDED